MTPETAVRLLIGANTLAAGWNIPRDWTCAVIHLTAVGAGIACLRRRTGPPTSLTATTSP